MQESTPPPGMVTLDLNEGLEPSTLNPTSDEEHLEAMTSPDQWPMRPPAVPVHMLPLVRRTATGTELSTLFFRDGAYLVSPERVYNVNNKSVREAKPADPTALFNQGWRGD